MKVCFVSGSYPPILCGIGDYVSHLAGHLAAQGAQVQVVTSKGAEATCDGGVIVHPVIDQWSWSALPVLLSHVRAGAPDIVNIQYPTQRYGRQPLVNLLPLAIRARWHVPAVTTIHEFSTYRRLGRWRVGLSVLTSSAVIVPDRANLEQMAEAWPKSRAKLRHIPLGANIEPQVPEPFDRRALRARYGASQTDIVAAYFGFVSPSKGIETLLSAMKEAGAQDPRLRLVLVANRDPSDARYAAYHRAVGQAVQESGLEDRVCWTGYLMPGDVSAYLASADIAALPFNDGASLRRTTLLTVMAHGLPVISTRSAAHTGRELGAEQGLVLAPVGDAHALAQAILNLARDPMQRDALAGRAREFARGFAWPKIAAETMSLYKSLQGG